MFEHLTVWAQTIRILDSTGSFFPAKRFSGQTTYLGGGWSAK
jgi:hypothetical protein